MRNNLSTLIDSNRIIEDILEPVFIVSFTTRKLLNIVEAMNHFIEHYNLTSYIIENDGNLVAFNFDNQTVYLRSYNKGGYNCHNNTYVIEKMGEFV